MIDAFAGKGEVDVSYDFGRVFPVRVFLDLMGFPFTMFDQFLAWEWDILHEPAIATKAAAVQGFEMFPEKRTAVIFISPAFSTY